MGNSSCLYCTHIPFQLTVEFPTKDWSSFSTGSCSSISPFSSENAASRGSYQFRFPTSASHHRIWKARVHGQIYKETHNSTNQSLLTEEDPRYFFQVFYTYRLQYNTASHDDGVDHTGFNWSPFSSRIRSDHPSHPLYSCLQFQSYETYTATGQSHLSLCVSIGWG